MCASTYLSDVELPEQLALEDLQQYKICTTTSCISYFFQPDLMVGRTRLISRSYYSFTLAYMYIYMYIYVVAF